MFTKLRYFRKTKQIKLTPSEKDLMRADLQAFMRAHPVRISEATRQLGQEAHPNFLSSFTSMMLKPLPITLSALLLLGGGTAFAAEQSLPNEALYPVKVQVNERIRATFTLNTEARAKWEARVAERRLEEAERLAAEQKLDANVQAQVETSFDEQAKLVQEKIAALKAEGNAKSAIELSNDFYISLQAHEAILTKLNTSALSASTSEAETGTPTDTQAELKLLAYKKQQSSAEMIAQAKLQFTSTSALSSDLKAKVSLLLQQASEYYQKGMDQFNQLEFKGAFTSYTQAEVTAGDVISLLKASATLNSETSPPLLPTLIQPTKEQPLKETEGSVKTEVEAEILPPKIDTSLETKNDASSETSLKESADSKTQLDLKF